MDSGGRLARSQRSPRQQTELMDAVAGVAVALRAGLGFARSPAKARRHPRHEQPSGVIAFVERRWPRRGGLFATLLLLVASTGLGIVKGGHLEQFVATVSEARNALANSAGFRITAVGINGRKQLTQDEVLAIGGVNGRSSLLFLDAAAVRDQLAHVDEHRAVGVEWPNDEAESAEQRGAEAESDQQGDPAARAGSLESLPKNLLR